MLAASARVRSRIDGSDFFTSSILLTVGQQSTCHERAMIVSDPLMEVCGGTRYSCPSNLVKNRQRRICRDKNGVAIVSAELPTHAPWLESGELVRGAGFEPARRFRH